MEVLFNLFLFASCELLLSPILRTLRQLESFDAKTKILGSSNCHVDQLQRLNHHSCGGLAVAILGVMCRKTLPFLQRPIMP